MTVVVGVDGGGTHIRAVVADRTGRVLARAEHEGAVAGVDEPEVVAGRVAEAVREAAGTAGVDLPVDAVWAGLAGAGREAARAPVARALGEESLAEVIVVGTDVEAAFEDAFGDGPGVLLIAGTGSIARARDAHGQVVRVGGWGERMGDEGSGFAIGVAALRSAARAEDGRGPPTLLARSVLEHLSLDSVEELVRWSGGASKADVAGLAPLVVEASSEEDGVARRIVDEAISDLLSHVQAAIERASPWPEPPELVLAGGLIENEGPLRSALVDRVETLPLRLASREIDAGRGATRLALAGLGQAYGGL